MLKIDFFRKATDIDELKEGCAISNGTAKAVIEKVVQLPENEYEYFTRHLVEISSVISENEQYMWVDGSGVRHCIFVTSIDASDGVVVCSLGANCARISAYATKHQLQQFLKSDKI